MRKAAISTLLCLVGILVVGLMVRARDGNGRNARGIARAISGRVPSEAIATPANIAKPTDGEGSAKVIHEYAKLPMSFEPNVGQANAQAKFLARGEGYTVFLTPGEAVLGLRNGTRTKPRDLTRDSVASPERRSGDTLRIKLIGANSEPVLAGIDELPGKSNYLKGNQPANWHVGIPTYRKVAEPGVYSGIDLVYYGTQRQLEYDFIVGPGEDPRVIQLAIEGPKKLHIDAQGELVARVQSGEVHLKKPVAYQEANGGKQTVAANYLLRRDGRVAFELGKYDKSRTLVIDPILSYSTYLGGSNIDGANAIAVAPDKTAFITGGTFSIDFPTVHPLQANAGGPSDLPQDVFVAKLSADGSALLYSTYLGGKNQDVGNGIAVDAFGDAYVTGATLSPDFPVTPPDVLNPDCGGDGQCGATFNPNHLIVSNCFVTKLNPAGTALIYSTFFGEYENVRCQAIAVDANQIAYITGATGPNLPVTVVPPPPVLPPPFRITGNAFQPTFGGGDKDAFVAKISATAETVEYSSYLGGNDEEIGYGIAVDSSANAYVTGLTYSTNFPVVNALQSTYGGAGDAFFAKVNTDGSGTGPGPLLYSTFLGGSNLDQSSSVAVDTSGVAYVTGFVGAGKLPFTTTASLCGVMPGAAPVQVPAGTFCGGDADIFAAKIDATKSGAASLLYFTNFGGSFADSGNGIAVDSSGNDPLCISGPCAYVTGSTVSPDFLLATAAIFQPQFGGGNSDAFVTKIDSTGATLQYSSYLGGTNTDIGNGIAVDATGAAYVAGQTCSLDLPLANPVQAAPGGNCDAFVSKVEILHGLEFNPAGLVFTGQSLNATSQPQVVTLTNGDVAQTIMSVAIAGTNAADFAETNNCGSSLAPGAQCTISVTFKPLAAGIRKAQVDVACPTCGSTGITYALNLTGTTSTLTLSAANLAFGNQQLGVPGTPQSIIATNDGTVPLTFSSIAASGDFSETDNCTKAPLQPTTNCVINVTYTPTTAGSSVGALTLTDNAPGSPQVVLLTGTGFGQQSDFTFSAAPTSAAVPAGKSAQFNITISPIGGFAQPITLSCNGLPKAASCASTTANPVTPSGPTTVTVIVNTGLRTFAPSGRPMGVQPPRAVSIGSSGWLALLAALLLGATALFGVRGRREAAMLLLVVVMICVSASCNGGGQAGAPSGTPAGTYQIGITGKSGVISHTATVTLQVE
jgi:hypothetical protein